VSALTQQAVPHVFQLLIVLDDIALDDIELVSPSWETMGAGTSDGELVEVRVCDTGKRRKIEKR
jgi:hypothetical protein